MREYYLDDEHEIEYDDYMDGCFNSHMMNMTDKQVYEAATEVEHTDVTDELIAQQMKKYHAIMPATMDTMERRMVIDAEIGRLVRERIEDYYRGVCDYKFKYERRGS